MEREEAFNQYYDSIADIIEKYAIDDLNQRDQSHWWFLRKKHVWYVSPDMQVYDCGPAKSLPPIDHAYSTIKEVLGLTIFPNLIMDLCTTYSTLIENLCPPGYTYQGRAEEDGHAYHVFTDGKIERWIAITDTTDQMKVIA